MANSHERPKLPARLPATLLAITALVLGYAVIAARPALAQDDDWTVVTPQDEPRPAHQSHPSKAAPAVPAANDDPQAAQQAPPAADGAHKVCGEPARPATEPYKSIVADIDRQWGMSTPVYESVQVSSPHVSRSGCIFYNPVFIAAFLRGETDEHGEPDKTSMLYAIMAHELGHIEHHDYERKASSVEKELEADRFSGYTLERMGIPRANITPFYSLGGDEFSGVHDHGFSNERITAFDQGWKAAEWNRPEDGGSAGGASTEDSSTADDSAAAAAVP